MTFLYGNSRFIEPLVVHKDERGSLFELLRNDNVSFSKFGQVYIIGDTKRGTIRAWHRHFKMDEWFCCVSGEVLFVLYDPERGRFQEHYIAGEKDTPIVYVTVTELKPVPSHIEKLKLEFVV